MMLNKMGSLHQTAEFMRAAGQDIPAVPTEPCEKLTCLRVGLIQEELDEFKEACEQGDLVAILDALADLQVVLNGAVLACGMQEVFPAALNEVHRSNMSKFPKNMGEVIESLKAYGQQGVEAVASAREGGYVILRKSDNKVLKSIHYSAANLAPLLA